MDERGGPAARFIPCGEQTVGEELPPTAETDETGRGPADVSPPNTGDEPGFHAL